VAAKKKVKPAKAKKVVAKKKAAPKKVAAKKAAPLKKAVAPKKAVPVAKKGAAAVVKTTVKPAKVTSGSQEIVAPLDDRIIVSVEDLSGERKTASGLILVGDANEGENIKGTVRAVGRGHLNKKGKIRPLALKVGDEILFPKVSGSKVQVAGTEMIILRESEVLGVLN